MTIPSVVRALQNSDSDLTKDIVSLLIVAYLLLEKGGMFEVLE